MGTYSAYKKLYQKVAADMPPFPEGGTLEENAARFEKTKANANRCITKVQEHSSTAILMDLFNLAFPGAPTMPVFSSRERERRRQLSNALRDAMLSDIAYCGNNERKYGANLPYQSLLFPEMYRIGNSGAEDNEHVQAVFDKDSEAHARWVEERVEYSINLHRKDNPNIDREQMRKDIGSQTQSQGNDILSLRMKSCWTVINNLDAMLDPKLSPEQLAENYLEIKAAQRAVEAVEDYKRMGEQGLFLYSKNFQAALDKLKPHLPRLNAAAKKLELMANPMYEYVDLDSLDTHDMRKLNDYWKEMRSTPKFQNAFQQRNANNDAKVKGYLESGVLMDNFTSFLEDAADYADIRNEIAAAQQKEILQNYSFDSTCTTCFSESPNTTTDNSYAKNRIQRVGQHHLDGKGPLNLYRDRPVAYEMGFRTVILSPEKSGLGITTAKPEALYNYTLTGTAAALDKTLEDADRWYKTNKHGYSDMRKQLKEIIKLGNLSEDFPGADLIKRKKLFSDLLSTSDQYLEIKRKNRKENDPVETARVEAARKAKYFAETKLRELGLINAAQKTASQYKDMKPEQLRARTAEENSGEKMRETIRRGEQAARDENPIRWLHRRYNAELAAKEGLPENLSRLMEDNLKKVEKAWEDDTVFVEAPIEKKPLISGRSWDRYETDETYYKSSNELDLVMGTIAATAMILEERKRLKMRGGPVETFFSNMADTTIARFGQVVFAKLNTNRAMEKGPLKDVLRQFDPRNDPNQYSRDYADLQPVFHAQDLTEHYLNTIKSTGDPARDKVFQDFVKEQIIRPAMNNHHLDLPLVVDRPRKQYDSMGHPIAPPNSETLRKIGADNQDLLAASVIHHIIQLERNSNLGPGPGELEQRLANDLDAFKKEIKNSWAFSGTVDGSRVGKISTQTFLMNGEVSSIARDYITQYNSKIREQNREKNSPPQNENRPAAQKNVEPTDIVPDSRKPEPKKNSPIT